MSPQIDSFDDVQCEEVFREVSFTRNERFEPGKCLISGIETIGVFDNHTSRFASFLDWETAVETARDLNNNVPILGNPDVYAWHSIPN